MVVTGLRFTKKIIKMPMIASYGAQWPKELKTFWERKAPPDDRNRIRMAMRCLLLRGARTMLIDAGSGDKMTPKQAEERPTLKSVVEGVHYAWRRKELLGTYLIDMNAMFFGMPTALFPAVAANYGAETVGLFYAAPSVATEPASTRSQRTRIPRRPTGVGQLADRQHVARWCVARRERGAKP